MISVVLNGCLKMKHPDYCCNNCAFMKDAEDVGWNGPYCSNVITINNGLSRPYLVGAGNTNVYMIVNKDFLCNKWEPKEGK